jgi:voltage-gated potassium channel
MASNALDLVVILLPLLRPLRMLRLLTLLDVVNRRAASSLRGRIAIYVVGATGLIIFCSSLAVLDAERANPDANITSFPDAVWWAATTVTTVGYGDRYPTTTTGRMVAVLLMLGGIALLGIVTAGLASWLLDRIREVEERADAATRRDVARLALQVDELRREVRELISHSPPAPQVAPDPTRSSL